MWNGNGKRTRGFGCVLPEIELLDAFGKNGQVQKVFRAFFLATAGLVLAQVADPAAAEEIVGMLAGIVPYRGTGIMSL